MNDPQAGYARSESGDRPLPAAQFMTLVMCCYAVLAWLWIPIVLLREVDAYTSFLTPPEIARDVGLAVLLMALPAALLSSIATICRWLLLRTGRLFAYANTSAWAIILLPTLWACLWQASGSASAWFKFALNVDLSLSSQARLTVAALLICACVWMVKRSGMNRFLLLCIKPIQDLRIPLLLLLAASVISVLITPPRLLTEERSPKEEVLNARELRDAPDIFLIVIDTLAETDANVCGDGPTLMPNLRAFAGKSSCFVRNYSNSNFTTPGTSSIETGRLPWSHWAVQVATQVAKPLQNETLAKKLWLAGYETHSVNANIQASPRHHGTESAYDSHRIIDSTLLSQIPRNALTFFSDTTLPFWFASVVPGLNAVDMYSHAEKNPYPPEDTYAATLDIVAKQKGEKPQFIWVQTLPPHDPYLPPPETKYKLLPKGELDRWADFSNMGSYPESKQPHIDKYRLRYQEAILGADIALGKFLQQLDALGRLNKAMVIVTSDHGESFERGFLGHAGPHIHNAVLQTPLLIKLPGQTEARRFTFATSAVDLAPTLIEVAKASTLPMAEGRSLLPALQGQSMEHQAVYAMSMEEQSRFRRISKGHYAVIKGNWKLTLDLARNTMALYNLGQDPKELKNCVQDHPEVGRQLRQLLDARLAEAELRRQKMFTIQP